jgi:hypothetical protein
MAIGGQNTAWKHGTNGAVSSNTAFTTSMRSVNVTINGEEVDSTTFGDAFREYEASFINGSFSSSYKYDTTVFGQLGAILTGRDTVTFEYGPDGTASTKPKLTGSMVMTSFSTNTNVGDLITIEVGWRISGTPTFGAYS